MLLEVQDLLVIYNKALILNNINLHVDDGELVSLVGANGAGKTTFLRAISGLVQWEKDTKKGTRSGEIKIEGIIKFNGARIDQLPANKIVEKGLIHCPERRRPFAEMTVLENLKTGAYLIKNRFDFRKSLELVYELFPVLAAKRNQVSGTLSGGEQQMLALGRAMMLMPRLICIDEPSIGLAPKVKEEVFQRIEKINKNGTTVLLVEQDVNLAFSMSSRNYILSNGQIVAEGSSEKLVEDETVRNSYLGL